MGGEVAEQLIVAIHVVTVAVDKDQLGLDGSLGLTKSSVILRLSKWDVTIQERDATVRAMNPPLISDLQSMFWRIASRHRPQTGSRSPSTW